MTHFFAQEAGMSQIDYDDITSHVLGQNPIGMGLTEALNYIIDVCSDEYAATVIPALFLGVTDEAVRQGRLAALEMERLWREGEGMRNDPGTFADPRVLAEIEAEYVRRFGPLPA